MKSFTDPRWLLVATIIPLLLLLFAGYQQFTLVESLLEAEHVDCWRTAAGATLVWMLVVAATGGFLAARRQALPLGIIVATFVGTVAYTWFVAAESDGFMPFDVPRWLRDGDLVLLLITAVMPTLALCLLAAVYRLTPAAAERRVWPNFAWALAFPVAFYLFVTGVIPGVRQLGRLVPEHLLVITMVAMVTVFLFLLVRGFYLLLAHRGEQFRTYRYLWLVPVAIVFPLLGLLVNNGDLPVAFSADGVFGDFSHPWFYGIAGLNGLLLCLPAYENKLYRLFLFLGRSVGLAYIAYFFVVFLPYLPLSLAAVALVGLGFLMLTPLLLFPLQISLLRTDYEYLRKHFRAAFLGVVGALAFCLLPLLVTLSYVADETALDSALDYLYAPADVSHLPVRTDRLERVLSTVEAQKQRPGFLTITTGTPYLTKYYKWLVLDNLMLSDTKIDDLRSVFFGVSQTNNARNPDRGGENIRLDGYTATTDSTSVPDARLTTVELWLTNQGQRGTAEFTTRFTLPDGVLVTDYWLDIEGRIEHGILAERRAATWVYNQIVGNRRDPGFLRYVKANQLALNVFPFAAGQTRRTAITFMHRGSATLRLLGQEIELAGDDLPAPVALADGSTFFSAAAKRALPQVQRKLGVHYVIDTSRRRPGRETDLIANLRAFQATLPAGTPAPRVTLAGTYVKTYDWDGDWEAALLATPPGGFFLQRALETIYRNELASPTDVGYQIVVVKPSDTSVTMTGDLQAFRAAWPEGPNVYYLAEGEPRLLNLSPEAGEMFRSGDLPGVRRYESANGQTSYLAGNDSPGMLPNLSGTLPEITADQTTSWNTAYGLYAHHLANEINGETGYRPWLATVQASFAAEVLLPVTAYLSLENEAQKEALRRKQADVLSADPALDLDEIGDAQRMSEPWWVWVLGLLVFTALSLRRTILP